DHPDSPIAKRLANKHTDRAVSQLLLDQSKLRNRLPKRLTLLRIANPAPNHHTRRANRRIAQLVPPNVQNIERNMMPLTNLTQQIRRRNLAVRQNQWTSRAAANPKLVLLLAHRKT